MNAGCAGKTVRSLERLRGVFTTRRYTNTRLPLALPLPLPVVDDMSDLQGVTTGCLCEVTVSAAMLKIMNVYSLVL